MNETYAWVIWTSHGTRHMNRHITYMLKLWMGQVTRMNEPCAWVIWMSHRTSHVRGSCILRPRTSPMNEASHACERALCRSHTNESYHIHAAAMNKWSQCYEWAMAHARMSDTNKSRMSDANKSRIGDVDESRMSDSNKSWMRHGTCTNERCE